MLCLEVRTSGVDAGLFEELVEPLGVEGQRRGAGRVASIHGHAVSFARIHCKSSLAVALSIAREGSLVTGNRVDQNPTACPSRRLSEAAT